MGKEYDTFLQHLKHSKKESVLFIINLIEKKNMTLKDVYFNFLIPAMKQIRIANENNEIAKWEENLIESRLKSAIEYTYGYIVKEKVKPINKKVLILLPVGEEEQVGALIASNIFELAGFETTYIDSNMSEHEMFFALEKIKPDYLTIGLKNYYNAFETQKFINEIIEKYSQIKIIVGGPVFNKMPVLDALKHDYFVKNYTEIFEIAKEVVNETSLKNSN